MRLAFRLLGARCRQLLRLRYHEELPYSRIAKILGATENTLTVQAGRCIRELRAGYQKLLNKGT
ncbi:MAG: RNA polymerase sigma factor [Desulfomonilaceae bacterium]